MGQYYKPVNIDRNEWLYSHKYDNGLKLMEHSYIDNSFVQAVENLLIPGGAWYKNHIVWAGDYADPEIDGKDDHDNLYHRMEESGEITPDSIELPAKYRYLCNHTKQLYVDRSTVQPAKYGYKINPLPLLTCEGNGRGGGDFHGEDERIGTWARDIISIEATIPEGYEQVDGQFNE